eukprot:bmy_19504T0
MSCKCDSWGVNSQSISQFIINSRTYSTKKTDCYNVRENLPFKIKLERAHIGEKFYEYNKNQETLSYKENLPEHQKCQTLKQAFEFNGIGKVFYVEAACVKHKSTHTGQQSCKDEEFRKNYDKTPLFDHERTGTGEKHSHLNQCGKSFCEKSAIKEYNKFNMTVKHCECITSGNNFSRKSYLTQPQRTLTEENPLVCNDRTQTGDKHFECHENRKSYQKAHKVRQRTHYEVKPYKCNE